jgi:hypothetical protein
MNKYVKITVNLAKGIDEPVIGTEVLGIDKKVVGKVIAYEKETGKATIRLKSEVWKYIAGETGISKNMYHEQKDN